MNLACYGKCTEPESRNVRLGLAADVLIRIGNLVQSYSMWPIYTDNIQSASWLCKKERFRDYRPLLQAGSPTCNEDTPSVPESIAKPTTAEKDDPDVIHVDNSSDLTLSTSLNDLEIAALHIDGQLIDVDAPPDIIDVVDEDDDIIDEEDPIPHDLADSDDEDLVNLDIDDGMSADVARGHGGDDHPSSHHIPTGCGGCLGNRGKGTRKPNLGGRRAGRQHTRQETRNLGLKAIIDKSGPVTIRFEFGDRETLMPLGKHAAHWANYLRELVRELSLHYPSWRQVPAKQKAGVMAQIGTQFDMRPYMESDRWPLIYAAIQQHLQKIYNGKKAALKERHWILDSDGTYDLERIRLLRPSHISEVNWDAQIAFWNDPKNRARATQNKQNRPKSKVMESSATREYPSLIHTFFLTHTVNDVFLNPKDKALYESSVSKYAFNDLSRNNGIGSNTKTGVPYTEDEIMAIVRGGKQRGHIPGVGRVLPRQGTVISPSPPCAHSSDVVKLKKREKVLTRQIGGGSGSGGRGDDEQGDDEDDGEDGEDEDRDEHGSRTDGTGTGTDGSENQSFKKNRNQEPNQIVFFGFGSGPGSGSGSTGSTRIGTDIYKKKISCTNELSQ
ncbi:hypothetical protein Tco_1485071 [Tanacetum coccineum]